MRPGNKYNNFYFKFRKLVANAEFLESLLKSELNQKITPEFQFGVTVEITRPKNIFQEFQAAINRLAFVKKGIIA